jgi:uncharacterized protein
MDTPQVTPVMLEQHSSGSSRSRPSWGPRQMAATGQSDSDGGDPRALLGVPMSTAHTLAAQRLRLGALGLATHELETLRDVDTFSDAVAVAGDAPHARFARALARFQSARSAA